MTVPPKLPTVRMDTLRRINSAIKVANEFLEPFTDAEVYAARNEVEFLKILRDKYFSIIVWLALRRLDQKEETFQGVDMVIDAIFVQLTRYYIYKELDPPDWSDLKKLSKTAQEVYNRERKFVGKQTDRFRAALKEMDQKTYEYLEAIWSGSPSESENIWKEVRSLD